MRDVRTLGSSREPERVGLLCRMLMLLLAGSCTLAGCDGSESDPGGEGIRKADSGRIPAYAQRVGDPVRGRDAFLNRAVSTCGIPDRVYRQLAAASPASSVQPIEGRTGRNAELPHSLTAARSESGVDLVTWNCLGCHAASLGGALIIGLGDEHLDLTVDPLRVVEATASLSMTDPERAEWTRWAERITAIADYMMTDTVGVSSARNLSQALMAHRDPATLAWSNEPLIDPPPEQPLPVSVPPLWGLGKKHALFYNGEGRGDHARYLALANALCTDTVEEAAALDAWLVDVRAYLAELEPPAYPFRIDPTLAERGEQVFERLCKECHGSYGDDWRYPSKVVALGTVETDPALARQAFSGADRFLDWRRQSFYGALGEAAPALGYIAPPLDGVWATAPYLHNGSVPSLALMLDSKSRPTYWAIDRPEAGRPTYDPASVGWEYRETPYGKAGAMSWAERNRIYDTTQAGYGNQGHTYGDRLSSEERRSLLEYLKTL